MSATPSCCHAVANFQADIRRVERKTLPLVTELWPAVLVSAGIGTNLSGRAGQKANWDRSIQRALSTQR